MKAFHTAGFLGSEYGPFLVDDPADAIGQRAAARRNARADRFARRYEAYSKLLAKARC